MFPNFFFDCVGSPEYKAGNFVVFSCVPCMEFATHRLDNLIMLKFQCL